jgi:hypothetical protein
MNAHERDPKVRLQGPAAGGASVSDALVDAAPWLASGGIRHCPMRDKSRKLGQAFTMFI